MEAYKCPRCVDEVLFRSMGGLLICQECDFSLPERMVDGVQSRNSDPQITEAQQED